MPSNNRHFLRLLQVEILDLIEDIQAVELVQKKHFEAQTESRHVFMANDALLNREIDSLHNFSKMIDEIDTSVYKDTASLAEALLLRSREIVRRHEDPEVVFVILKRKIDKVLQYLATGKGMSDC